jgi:hypothetical protein
MFRISCAICNADESKSSPHASELCGFAASNLRFKLTPVGTAGEVT